MTITNAPWRHRLLGVMCTTILILAGSLYAAPPSQADICQNFGLSANCFIVFGEEKHDGGGGGGDGPVRPPCNLGPPEYHGVPCDNTVGGPWSNEHQCYVLKSVVQPDPSDPIWQEEGALYDCMGITKDHETFAKAPFWAEEPPTTETGGNLIKDLQTAVGLQFRAMRPGVAPSPIPTSGTQWDGWRMAPVGTNVWMWPREPDGSTWGPIRVEDESTGYFVKAGVTHVVWEMGDGTKVRCGKSEPYQPWMFRRDPQCGHKYEKPGNYLVKVHTFWSIDYRDAAGNGHTDLKFTDQLWVRVGESQVVSK